MRIAEAKRNAALSKLAQINAARRDSVRAAKRVRQKAFKDARKPAAAASASG